MLRKTLICILGLLLTVGFFVGLDAIVRRRDEQAAEPEIQEEEPAVTDASALALNTDEITSVYLRWYQSGYYDLLANAESQPELLDAILTCFSETYTAVAPYEPIEGTDNPFVWFYSGDTQLLGLYTADGRVLYENYWYEPGCEYDFDALMELLADFETEEHRLEHNPTNNTFSRAGSYGADIVEIP